MIMMLLVTMITNDESAVGSTWLVGTNWEKVWNLAKLLQLVQMPCSTVQNWMKILIEMMLMMITDMLVMMVAVRVMVMMTLSMGEGVIIGLSTEPKMT